MDITHHHCRLTFGSSPIEIDGAAAQSCALVEAGCQVAGTLHGVSALTCTVDVGK